MGAVIYNNYKVKCKMKQWLILFIILMSATVYADKGEIEIYEPKEIFDLSIHLTNETGDVAGANCSIQIRNATLGVILDDNMNEIGGGWYNYTHNQSRAGKFFCKQNCSMGTQFAASTCDFVIEGDENLSIAITLLLIFVIIGYFALIIIMSRETFSVHGVLKSGLSLMTIWFLLVPMDFAIKINNNAGDLGIASTLEMMFSILIYLNVGITLYFILFMIIGFVRSIQDNLPEEDRGKEQ